MNFFLNNVHIKYNKLKKQQKKKNPNLKQVTTNQQKELILKDLQKKKYRKKLKINENLLQIL